MYNVPGEAHRGRSNENEKEAKTEITAWQGLEGAGCGIGNIRRDGYAGALGRQVILESMRLTISSEDTCS
ncbi:MAG: hypothetical protein IH960_07365 [Chloroflexi bacterium]|nr:hypothetical protein [Chloroflexota bacterium]